MNETAKWRIEGEGAWEMTRFWLSDSTGRRIEDIDMPSFVESLETSLAEAQEKIEWQDTEWLAQVTALNAELAEAQKERDQARERIESWDYMFNVELVTAEQQLAEVKAQLDAQAGVIKEMEARCERLIKSIEFAWGKARENHAAYLSAIRPEEAAAEYAAHVREPETK